MRTVFLKVWAKEPNWTLAPVLYLVGPQMTKLITCFSEKWLLISFLGKGLDKLPTEAGGEP